VGRVWTCTSITDAGVEERSAEELKVLLDQPDALIWVDMPICLANDAAVLSDVFGFHELAVRDCVERNHISKLHFYDDHVFTVLHAPEMGSGGHVHYVELDQFVGPNYLVTVHGPLNPAVEAEVAFADTRLVLRRIEQDEIHPTSPMELSYSIVSAMARRETDLVAALAEESGRLEQQVTDEDHNDDPEVLLEELFQVGHQLLAICTMATHSAATYGGMAKRIRSISDQEKPLVADLAELFEMVVSMADGQRQFLHGVIEFYQTRTSTHLTVAAEKLATTSVQQNDDMRRITAWVAIIAVPTAVTGLRRDRSLHHLQDEEMALSATARQQAMSWVSSVVAMWHMAELWCCPASTMGRWCLLLATDLAAVTVDKSLSLR
jgi:Mg2+ and Co2+ transporter CorA